VWQLLATGAVVFTGSPVSSTEKTDHHDMTEILMKVGLNTINHNHNLCEILLSFFIDGHFFLTVSRRVEMFLAF
jgi:hypothetical protein